LHLSEHAAYGRIEAARVAHKYPVLLLRLQAGDLTLTTIAVLAPHLTPDNHPQLIDAARRKSKREVEHLVATLRPQPSVPSLVRKLPPQTEERRGTNVATSPVSQPVTLPTAVTSLEPVLTPPKMKPALIQPLAAERYKVQFTVTGTTCEKLRRVQDLMRHTCPNGDVGIVFERALTLLLEHLEKIKLARVSRPQRPRGATSGSRHVPAAVRRAVWMRDNGQCAFIGTRGRCTERGFLELHHVVPFADGGRAVVDNIQLRCRAHNQYEADRWFGAGNPPVVREHRDYSGWLSTRSGPSCQPR
jgi:5-methylcytosine-specific restriction endonuclease McrA